MNNEYLKSWRSIWIESQGGDMAKLEKLINKHARLYFEELQKADSTFKRMTRGSKEKAVDEEINRIYRVIGTDRQQAKENIARITESLRPVYSSKDWRHRL